MIWIFFYFYFLPSVWVFFSLRYLYLFQISKQHSSGLQTYQYTSLRPNQSICEPLCIRRLAATSKCHPVWYTRERHELYTGKTWIEGGKLFYFRSIVYTDKVAKVFPIGKTWIENVWLFLLTLRLNKMNGQWSPCGRDVVSAIYTQSSNNYKVWNFQRFECRGSLMPREVKLSIVLWSE